MPFTASHPAAVLPLIRLGLPPAALVIGSMVPDLPYFLPFGHGLRTHTLVAVLTLDPLLGGVCLVLWQVLVGPLAAAVAPEPLRRRLPSPRPSGRVPLLRSALALALLALVLGSATHVLWDEFTHRDRFGTHHLPWLAGQHGQFPGYEWAQYASGVVGALVLLVALRQWWRAAPAARAPLAPLGPKVVLLVRVAVVLGALVAAGAGFGSAADFHQALFAAVTWGGGAGLILTLLAAVACAPRLRS